MKSVTGTALLTLLLAIPAKVHALATETMGNAPATNQPEWAEGVVDAVNLENKVYSQWVNGNENFFYRGDARALNEAIRKFAAVKDEVRQLILLPGSSQTQTLRGMPIDFDWQLHVPSGIYRAVSKRKHAVMTVYVKARKPGPVDRKQVEKWIADLKDESFKVREKADEELQKLGKATKPILRAALKGQPDLEARRRIEKLLAKLLDLDVTDLEIPKGITVVSVDDLLALRLKELKDANITICGMAIQDLSSLAPYSDKVVPAVTEMLRNDNHEWVRRVAAGCLSRMGSQAKSAVPALKQGLDDADANVRKAFQTALEQIENAREQPGQEERIKKERAILKEIIEFKKAAAGRND